MSSRLDAKQDNILRPFMPELDSVRGVAILMVVLFHGFGVPYGPNSAHGLLRLFAVATQQGWAGVNLFFVLSGFLITGILLDTKERPRYYSRFYYRRSLRILPAYYALLLILLVVPLTGWFANRHISWKFVGLSAVYLSNVTTFFGVREQYGVLWSLAVEEHFYLIWPTAIKLLSKRGVLALGAMVLALVPLFRVVALKVGSTSNGYTWLVADGLALGAMFAVCLRRRPQRLTTIYVAGASLAGAAGLFTAGARFGILHGGTLMGAALRPTAMNLFFLGGIALALLAGTSRYCWLVDSSLLRFFGRISYGLYLVHMLVFDFVDHFLEPYYLGSLRGRLGLTFLRLVVGTALAVGVAYLSRVYFEEWFLKLRTQGPAPSSIPDEHKS